MPPREPRAILPTHEVTNQPPPIGDRNLFDDDPVLAAGLEREGAGWAKKDVRAFGALAGSEHVMELADLANRFPPELRSFDRYGQRIDEVEFHPAYHELMELAITHKLPSLAWTAKRKGGHVAHVALSYLLNQVEGGVMCPVAMTYAVVPALRNQPELAAEWEPRLQSGIYDRRSLPASEKKGATMGMFMTEKQGGSDVRTNSTRAAALGQGGPGGEYELTGHKWFCSAPMSDAFLTLAYTDDGLSCFLVPRWKPDGTRNALYIQRVKDKLGNRSNASSEIELLGTWGRMVGEEGRGVRTIIDMVQHTRLYCALGSAAMMRQGLTQALHHTAHRSAF
ncbi:MAG: acyl-CoA dehydrogenase family protein, partial [Alphaproteobacteria bacterium]